MRRLTIATAVIGAIIFAAALPASAFAPDSRPPAVIASFEGKSINLADRWGEAQACFVDEDGTRCYRSEAEMDRAEGAAPANDTFSAQACTPSVRLYRGTNHSGGVLMLTNAYAMLNLSSYGFDNDTSSYRIGQCASRFYDTTSGSGLYSGSTGANVSRTTMLAGWDNRIGSVYIG